MDINSLLSSLLQNTQVSPNQEGNHKPKNENDFSNDLENWMKNLPDSIRSIIPIINLAIPGTHNSGSYAITKHSEVAPDADESLVLIHKLFPDKVCDWAKTQEYTFEEQLNNGIRCFDLRLAPKNDDIYYVHGVYSCEVTSPLIEILNFLIDHPHEFVILNCQHFYNFGPAHHEVFKNTLLSLFETMIYSSGVDFPSLTLSEASKLKKQLIVIYCDDDSNEKFFKSSSFPCPWANTTSLERLVDYSKETIKARSPNTALCTQLILTPDGAYIIGHLPFTLKTACARDVLNKCGSFLENQVPGPFKSGEDGKVNVFVADFVDLDDNFYTRTVIDLNMKLIS
ncbi:unnamed protein product [Chironomus riparius]|uniref:Phosphatidylinositol-specific phospholipase C X domain-containing protein n=1 Tax=Chironomus riparius TaxID=315576 RepID=A0A9N9RK75_9DIPT|nr:unnamed protein product [Chironomus riparius]